MFKRQIRVLLLIILLIPLALSATALAQSITLNGTAQELADADEWFSDNGNPLDMDTTCDLPRDGFYYEPKSASNGVWTGVHPDVMGPSVSLLPVLQPGSIIPYYDECGHVGILNTINANKYNRLSWKQKLSAASAYSVLWSYDTNFTIYGNSDYDGYLLPGAGVQTPSGVWSIRNKDLVTFAPSQTPWSGQITGLAITPSVTQPAGSSTSFDWFRLIDDSTSPTISLSWDATAGNKNFVALFVDSNSSGYDGTELIQRIGVDESLNMKSGILPPGAYYFYAELKTHNNVTATTVAQSNYVGPFILNGKPIMNFSSPSRMSGQEYATSEALNPWDMDGEGDLANLYSNDGSISPPEYRGFENWSFQNGYFFATSINDLVGGTVDTQVHLKIPSNKPVNTNFYRYFCYRMQVDSANIPRNGNAVDLNLAGWVSRFIWQRNSVFSSFGSTGAQEYNETSSSYPDLENGFQTYCIDLWDDANIESGATWRAAGFVTTARFDPMEATPATNFAIDYAGLYAEDQADSNDDYVIEWTVNDPDADPLSIALYYDSDNQGFDGQLIRTLNNQDSGTGTYTWRTAGVASGSYYVYAIVSDGLNTTTRYSEVPIYAGSARRGNAIRRTPGDFDGDGKTDFTIIRAQPRTYTAYWYTLHSQDHSSDIRTWGHTGLDLFLDGDADGDLLADEWFARSLREPYVTWYSTPSGNPVQEIVTWGVLGDVPITADIDGDNIDDYVIFRPSDGTWWAIRSSLGYILFEWGLPGDMPTVKDFDGDGWDDIAIWRPSDGYWWLLQSTLGASRAPNDIIWRQFGLPGDHPMPGDYTGDGKADMVLWRPSGGWWFVCSSDTDFDCTQATVTQFGLPGDSPLSADFDGDGILDYAIWRPSEGNWYYRRSSDGQILVQQWGVGGDIPLSLGIADQMSRLN